MVAEYAERFYVPAANRLMRLDGEKGHVLSLMDWIGGNVCTLTDTRSASCKVDVHGGSRELLVGSNVKITTRVSLSGLSPWGVRVQAYSGV